MLHFIEFPTDTVRAANISLTRMGEYTPTESSLAQSSSVRLTKTRQALCGLLIMAAAAVGTCQQSRVESHDSCRVTCLDTASSLFVSQTLMIERDGCQEMDVEKLILLVKDHEAIFDASRFEHRNRDYINSVWLKIAHEMDVGKWSAWVFT